jgi:hypothetical protein
MLLLGHIGITMGIAWCSQAALNRRDRAMEPSEMAGQPRISYPADAAADCWGRHERRKVMSLDYRLVLLGSMLPDLIDKPLGIYLFGDVFGSGRIFAHTALFSLALIVAGVLLYRRRGGLALLTLGYGTFIHLLLDSMWGAPSTLFWPLHGWAFTQYDNSHWLSRMLFVSTHHVPTYAAEAVGAAIIVAFLISTIGGKRIRQWVKTGTLG